MGKDTFFLEKVYKGWGIPAFLLDSDNKPVESFCESGMLLNETAAKEVRALYREGGIPSIWFETPRIVFMGFEDDG